MMSDRDVLRDLATRYREVCEEGVQDERRELWRKKNDLQDVRPLIYVRAFAWQEMEASRCVCQDDFYRRYENELRQLLFWAGLGDDSIFEPWLTVYAVHQLPSEGLWGVPIEMKHSEAGGFCWRPPLKNPEDIAKLIGYEHCIDEAATARLVDKLTEAVGDILPINVSRRPAHFMWDGDIATNLAKLRGLDQMMYDMVDRPEWLHELLGFMRDTVLASHQRAEEKGDWRLGDHQNQSMPYAESLADPACNSEPVKRKQLWTFCAAQETVSISPGMFDEFMLEYQRPLMEPFGLAAYGCCEDLSGRIGLLRKIPNLRRIAVSPFADAAKCAEQIGRDYVVSYRPSPADMVSYDLDASRIRRILTRDLSACKDCHVDITLKDVETVENDPGRVKKWVAITRRVIDEVWG